MAGNGGKRNLTGVFIENFGILSEFGRRYDVAKDLEVFSGSLKLEIEDYFECTEENSELQNVLKMCAENLSFASGKNSSQIILYASAFSDRNSWFFDLNLDIPMDTLLNSAQFSKVMKNAIIDEEEYLRFFDGFKFSAGNRGNYPEID
ncbi:unnamed protein product [Caenorhabditis angaria]|uniref:Uncharacterized protein n=1 Tax=Caenorhabditis angaria TaxID=860376 RepID=A0A9P1N8I8_9PELO|nr:unnamed protein product [Caenorhabditis angaria]